MSNPNLDIRWVQRLEHFSRALDRLRGAKKLADTRPLSDLEKQGAIKAYEFSYELGWNLLKDYLEWQGSTDLYGSRSVIRTAFRVGLILDGDDWMAMLEDRNLSAHHYDEETANRILTTIQIKYVMLLDNLERRMVALRDDVEGRMT